MKSRWSYDDIPDQTGRVALVTGANSGLGFYTAQGLAAKGAHVLLGCRSVERGKQAASDIVRTLPQAKLDLVDLDLADLTSVKRCAEQVGSRLDRLDILVNNAGVMAIPRQLTAQGFERQFGVNHLGHFALTGQLLPYLLRSDGSRIVNVSSMAHRQGRMAFDDLNSIEKYSRFGAYAQSKLANLLFTFALQQRLANIGATTISIAAHPGFAATNLTNPGFSGTIPFLRLAIRAMNAVVAQSASQGALPQLFAATAPDVRGGNFIGPDGWAGMRGHPEKVRATDAAYDEGAANHLWRFSKGMTGENFALLAE